MDRSHQSPVPSAPSEPTTAGPDPEQTIPGAFARTVERRPSAPALSDGHAGLTYAELDAAVRAASDRLAERIGPGSRVMLQVRRSAEYVVAYLAVLRLGAVVAPLPVDAGPEEVLRDLRICAPDLLLRDFTAARGPVPPTSVPVARVPVTAHATGRVGLPEPAGGTATAPPPREDAGHPDATALLLSTSGSYGMPKRVALSHRAVLANARAHRASLDLGDERETALVTVPPGFGYANTVQLVGQLLSGGHVVLLEGTFLPSRFGALVQRHRVTTTLLVPSMLRLLTQGGWYREYDLSSLRHIVFGGAPTPPGLLERVGSLLPGTELVETYGQTEAGPRVTTLRGRDRAAHPGTVGRAIPGVEITVRAPDGSVLPPGRTGEIAVRSPGVMKGYHGAPEETARVLRDGWLYTGDLGSLDPEGHLTLRGRLRNIAIVNGMNVSLEEVETCLSGHRAVEEAVCRPADDVRSGERLVAHVRLAPGYDPSITDALLSYCRERLSRHKVPQAVVVVPDFPRTRNGKIIRRT
ncbi:MAG TPA: class I adenylate-forming enzyme family protein [Streptomyces sp.]|uniref:class I adenylate-forming enzyme family protein n=1 Tax=Streptomyces sp. TaxID=1931 RepID=UPI002D2E677D|nr:class I adenylate-forming enzyme family protein [Streptomyces sp.]HZG04297.1 class I adenylate-forming enzyme family protein [Streptomyces sp.]